MNLKIKSFGKKPIDLFEISENWTLATLAEGPNPTQFADEIEKIFRDA